MMSDNERLHRDETKKKLSPEGRKYFELIEFDEKEELITEIRKHPFGIFLISLVGAFVVVALLIFMVIVSTANFSEIITNSATASNAKLLFIVLCLFLIVGAVIVTMISIFLYKSNVIYVTNEKIAQVIYTSIFNRKISQLSIGDVQDVTVTQKGVFSRIYKFGTLVIETAGEQQNYTFSYVPDPYQNSRLIVGAHEKNLVLHGN